MRTNKEMSRYFTMKIIRNILIAASLLCSTAATYAMPAGADASRQGVEMSAMPVVKVVNGQVEIHLPGDENRQVEVYALTGQRVKTVIANPGVTVIDLPAGYYIVKCDRLSQRVIVR